MLEAQCIELGASQVRTVRQKIERALGDTQTCVLLGGPPCQPFSLAGRSRNRRGTRYSDGQETRHQLYVEYLQIIADFWPKVFVMENVRGMLSAKFDGKMMFSAIAEDLQDPTAALRRIPGRGHRRSSEKCKYRLYPISPRSGHGGSGLFQEHEDLHDFIVRSEEHGVPQARHRLILIGVREDIAIKPDHLEKEQPVPAERVLAGLPELRSGLSRDDSQDAWQANLRASSDVYFRKARQPECKIDFLYEFKGSVWNAHIILGL
jgi:DNA (cytosine-5)-methyltransferase 1